MSTTQKACPDLRRGRPSVYPAGLPEPSVPAQRMVRRPARHLPWRPLGWAGAALGVLLGGGIGLRYLRAPRSENDVQLFTITLRSFPVILQQKGEVRAARQIDVRNELQGRATILRLVEEGKTVKKGDLLVELASDEIEEKVREAESREIMARAAYEAAETELQILKDKNVSEIRKARVKLSLAEQELSKYREGEAVQSEQEAQLAVEEAQYNLRRSEEALADSEDLFREQFITRLDLENERAKVYQDRIKLKNAQLALEVLKKYTIPMGLQQKQSDLEDAQKELEWKQKEAVASEAKLTTEAKAKKSDHKLAEEKLARMLDQKSKTRIFAPDDGMVVYFKEDWWDESDIIKAGAQVREQQILIQLPDTSSMKVMVRVHEAKAERLKADLPAVVQIEGLSGRQFTGRVSKIAVLADSRYSWLNPNIKEYQTEVLLDGTFSDLKPGLTAHVQIKVAQLDNVLAAPVQSVFAKGCRYFVFVQEGQNTRPVEVQLGLASTEFVEITQGLQEGQCVRLVVSDELRLMLPEDTAEPEADPWSTPAVATQPVGTQPSASQPTASQPTGTQGSQLTGSQPCTPE